MSGRWARTFVVAVVTLCGAGALSAAPPAASQQRSDLLAGLDVDKAQVSGRWEVVDGILTSVSGAPARLTLADAPADRPYEIRVVLERPAGGDAFGVFLPVGTHCVAVLVRPHQIGLDTVDGQRFDANVTTHKGNFDDSAPHGLLARVTPHGDQVAVTVEWDGRKYIDWQGSEKSLSLDGSWEMRQPYRIALGAWNTRFHMRSVTLLSSGNAAPTQAPTARSPSRAPATTAPTAAGGSDRDTAVVEVSIPCARPAAAPEPLPGTAATGSDSDAIERPEYRNRPKALVRSVTSVTVMMVRSSEDGGEAIGLTSDIIATVQPESRRSNKAGVGFVRADGDEHMRVAFEEAVRAVTLRYPLWEPGHVDVSFGEKFVAHGGPSAGAAFAVLMLSSLEGFDLDPGCAITGDITADWRVRKVGGVTAKLRGATLDKCQCAVIPEGNEAAFTDMALLFDPSALWDLQVFSAARLPDVIAVVRRERAPRLREAMATFADVQSKLRAAGAKSIAVLHAAETRDALRHVLELAPNHLSAKCLLAIANGTAPRTLSLNATCYRLGVILYPYRQILDSGRPIDRSTLPAYVTANARKRLGALRAVAEKGLLPLITDTSAFVEAVDGYAGSGHSGNAAATLVSRAEALHARIADTSSDPDLLERMVHEGY